MQARSIEAAGKFKIPLYVKSSFSNKKGTLITKEVREMEDVFVSGIALNKGEAKITICDVPDRPGVASRIFGEIAKNNINIDMIIQNVSRIGRTDVSFTVTESDLPKTLRVAEKISKDIGAKGVVHTRDIAKVSVVGIGMRSHAGVAATMFKALASRKINIEMISTSEIKISCVVKKKKGEEAVRALHRAFGLGRK
jgi:aspartate kinase